MTPRKQIVAVSVDELVAAIINAARDREIIASKQTAFVSVTEWGDWFVNGVDGRGCVRRLVLWSAVLGGKFEIDFAARPLKLY
jgi:hypothetical protein